MASRTARLARLAELREARANKGSRAEAYEIKDAVPLYEEVDEEGYKQIVRKRLDQDDFVVDDNGAGYADDGREEWHGQREYSSDEESLSDEDRAKGDRPNKRKRKDDVETRRREERNIKNYFGAQSSSTLVKTTKHVSTAEDVAFMDDLLGEVNINVAARRSQHSAKYAKQDRERKRPRMSPEAETIKPTKSQSFSVSSTTATGLSTPPQDVQDIPEENFQPMTSFDDEDQGVQMSEAAPPSSPVANAVERKVQASIKTEEDDDDDMMEVVQAKMHTGPASASVNISGSRPAAKAKKIDYPTPGNSSPTGPAVADPIDASAWNNITSKLNVVNSSPSEAAAIGKLSAQDALEEDGSLRFFWIDYTELNGSLLLFGKVKNKKTNAFASCFVKVDNILRKLFFLPRETRVRNGVNTSEEVDMSDVYEEVDAIMTKRKVGMHKIKPCTRKYSFELPGIPREAEYLKLLYPYDKAPLDMNTSGETFSHVFGTNTSLFEQFVLWKNIMGPCWLKIEEADFGAVNNASWCKLELQASRPNLITPLGDSDNLEAPPLTMMSLALRTVMNTKDNKQEILMISARIYENLSLSDTTPPEKLPCKTLTVMRPNGEGFPTGFRNESDQHNGVVKLERSEAGLLSLFLGHLQRLDPDVLVGHRLEDLDYSILLSRLRERKTPGWHRIGRLRRTEWPKTMGKGSGSFFAERQLVAGRLLCDLGNDMGKSLMTKCQSWSLAEMCELVLGKGHVRRELDNEAALKTWAATREGLMNYLRHCEADTYFIAAIALKVQMLPLTKVLTNLAGNSWARTLTGTRAERNEYILLHEFHRNKYICPDKEFNKGKAKQEEEPAEGEDPADTKKKDKFKGGLVFEPQRGLYDRVVLVMDFNSLYPSIIQEYNICFTTVERASFSEEDDRVPDIPGEQDQGILPRLIATLVNRRREVKKLMKDKTATSDQLATWDIKQLALKLTANSMYGCLGYTRSRFYARPLAMLTTFKGREILSSTRELAETRQLQVIYGDTDSVMINTNMDNVADALKVGNEFKRAVNERYRLLEIDIDNTFRRLLLHAKKKYAAINMVEVNGKFVDKLEVKGLDMRRREYCALSKETSSKLLNLLLSGEEPETVVEQIHEYLRELAEKMRQYTIPIQKYTIFTQLSKNPTEYPNSKSMPAVQAALKLVARGKPVRAKDVMSFIITGANHGSQESASANALPVDEVLKPDSGVKPDIDYYLHKQILPPVERLCAPISLTDVTRLAECLGLDTSKYRVSTAGGPGSGRDGPDALVQPLDSQVPDRVRFASCKPLPLRCLAPACRHTFSFRSPLDDPSTVSHSGIKCPVCANPLSTITVVAQLEHAIRELLARYYEGWLTCDDPSCGARTRQMSVYGHRCLGPRGLGRGCLGRMGWGLSEKAVWTQLVYWERAFDVDKLRARVRRGERGEGPASSADSKVGEDDSGDGLAERMGVLAEKNRERFGVCRGVVRAYLDRSGRQWVNMGSLFGFIR